uniref:Uncharacterized protein n=1 Tax=Ananas comosus var. bracteatus TaxID=296719 RepID=A0A6V7PQI5_ANACO|nr:unnamed protein product [Ananas comosus var. bracteatus]
MYRTYLKHEPFRKAPCDSLGFSSNRARALGRGHEGLRAPPIDRVMARRRRRRRPSQIGKRSEREMRGGIRVSRAHGSVGGRGAGGRATEAGSSERGAGGIGRQPSAPCELCGSRGGRNWG